MKTFRYGVAAVWVFFCLPASCAARLLGARVQRARRTGIGWSYIGWVLGRECYSDHGHLWHWSDDATEAGLTVSLALSTVEPLRSDAADYKRKSALRSRARVMGEPVPPWHDEGAA